MREFLSQLISLGHIYKLGASQLQSISCFMSNIPVEVVLQILLHRRGHGLLWLIYIAWHGLQNAV